MLPPQLQLSQDYVLVLVSLLAAAVCSWLLRWHYCRYARSLADKSSFAANFIPVTLAVVLIISIIKSSLALSLGLVGALSIVRFRTPIKDPEELAYLFICIAVGIGLGAAQFDVTLPSFVLIMAIMTLRGSKDSRGALPLHLDVWVGRGGGEQPSVRDLSSAIEKCVAQTTLCRFDVDTDGLSAAFRITDPGVEGLAKLTGALQEKWPQARVTAIHEQRLL